MLYFISIFFIAWEMLCCRFLVDTFSDKRKYKSRLISEIFFLGLVITETITAYEIRDSLPIRLSIAIIVTTVFMYAEEMDT